MSEDDADTALKVTLTSNSQDCSDNTYDVTSGCKTVGKASETTMATPEKNALDRKFLYKIRHDDEFRRNLVKTLSLMWSAFFLGCRNGEFGPTFPDLRLIVKKDLQSASWLFTIGRLGFMTGAMMSGFLYDKFNRLLLLFLSVSVCAVLNIALPWCSIFPLLLAVRFIAGNAVGSIETGSNSEILMIWAEESRPFVQAMHFSFSVGAILSPLYAKQFLSPEEAQVDLDINFNNSYSTHEPVTEPSLGTAATTQMYISQFYGATHKYEEMELPGNGSGTTGLLKGDLETRVHFSFLLTGIVGICAALLFLYLYLGRKPSSQTDVLKRKSSRTPNRRHSQTQYKLLFLVLIASMFFTYNAVEFTISAYFVTFSINQLGWTKDGGSVATAVFWLAITLGRLSGIVIAKFVKPSLLLGISSVLLLLCHVCLWCGTVFYLTPLVWISVACGGLVMSIQFPSLFVWTSEAIMPVTGKVASVFMVGNASGSMVNPVVLGYIMENYSQMCFVYVIFGESVVFLLLFSGTFLLTKLLTRKEINLTETEMELYV